MPVVAMTANAMSGDRERFLAAGMDDYISKPIDSRRLAQVIERVMVSTADAQTVFMESVTMEAELVDKNPVPKPACNLAAALAKLDGDGDLLTDLARLFVETSPQNLRSLHEAFEAGEAELIGDVAHAIKGSVRYFAADSAYDVAQQLEIISRDGKSTDIETTYQKLHVEIERLQSELQAVLDAGVIC